MKKGAIKTSGIITLILSIIFAVISFIFLNSIFELNILPESIFEIEIVAKISELLFSAFIGVPQTLIASFGLEIDPALIQKCLAGAIAFFSLLMIFWGIKEIALSHKDDFRFARCKYTCGFMMFIKFLFFVLMAGFAVCCFLIEDIKVVSVVIGEAAGFEFTLVAIYGGLALISLLLFLLAVLNIAKVAKAVDNGEVDGQGQQYDPNYQNQQNYQATMQANMPPMQGYQQQSVQAQFNPQVQAEEQAMASSIIPGQNGVPINITEKGIQDLERLERLRLNGAITQENYQIMWQKICLTNLQK